MRREEQILLITYAQERDLEEVERSPLNAIPLPIMGGKK